MFSTKTYRILGTTHNISLLSPYLIFLCVYLIGIVYRCDVSIADAPPESGVLVECIGTLDDIASVKRELKSECNGRYKGYKKVNIQQLRDELEAAWHARASCIPLIDLCEANLIEADLSHVDLMFADLKRSLLIRANLAFTLMNNAALDEARLNSAILVGADLSGADLTGADLGPGWSSYGTIPMGKNGEMILEGADLTKADLSGADLTGANFSYAILDEVIFEPKPGALPDISEIALARGLWSMTYRETPQSLIELREAFKKAGLRWQEREMTCAIKRAEAAKAGNWFEMIFSWVFFDITCRYGMLPLRPLYLIAIGIWLFAIPYMISIRFGKIFIVWHPDRILDRDKQDKSPLIVRNTKLPLWSLYFSLLSAFHFGWKELNVGNWIARIQPKEYSLRATGWARVISGIQSLMSAYLLALWALSYFGRPFE